MLEENNLKQISDKIQSLSNDLNVLNTTKDKIASDIETKTTGKIKKWFSYWIGGGILSLVIMYFSVLHNVSTKSADHIANSIRDKFSEPKIATTLNDVAENQAKEIIENNLKPAIEEATITVNQKINSFETNLQQFKNKYNTELARLAKEVEYLKNRNMVLRLGDKAIAEANAESFDKLEGIYESASEEDLKLVAHSEIYRVKLAFINTTRIKGTEITYRNNRTGKVFKDTEIPTEALIESLNNNTNWQIRARATEILKTRKEKQVPETLLNAIQNDKNLEVRAKAIKSFEGVTGFKSSDVLKYLPPKNWWNTNKDSVDLKDLQTIQSAIENNSENEN